jgi:hypothetical protein
MTMDDYELRRELSKVHGLKLQFGIKTKLAKLEVARKV